MKGAIKNCWACRYLNIARNRDDIAEGLCERYPKAIPVLADLDWCGEFKGEGLLAKLWYTPGRIKDSMFG